MSGMSRMNSNNNKKIKSVMNVNTDVNKSNIKSIDKFDNSFLRNTSGNFVLKVLMGSQIIFSYIEFLLQNKRKHSNICLDLSTT